MFPDRQAKGTNHIFVKYRKVSIQGEEKRFRSPDREVALVCTHAQKEILLVQSYLKNRDRTKPSY